MGSQVQKSDEITFSDYLGLMTCVYEWADSYDSKDWDRLRKVIAPTLRVCSALPCLFLLSHTKYRL
ncbi:succinate dehydrogenase flavoprotein subunit [Pyricularia oryzae]|nr:succinate dehydrogenase flavoprotein subunit [Pyricularia oryzae]KAI6615066.1 succinate dehydrogenase flavoprotein subunit [Pyricularia oryzae]